MQGLRQEGIPRRPYREIVAKLLQWERISLTDTIQNNKTMSRLFRVTPKRIKRTNGQVLTPDMSVVVTTKTHATSPFTNGAQELKEAYMRLYGFDYQKAFRYGVEALDVVEFDCGILWVCENRDSFEAHEHWMKRSGRVCVMKLQ